MRITIDQSATRHLITAAEIRTVVTFPELRYSLTSRLVEVEALPVLHVGRAGADQPHIEVIADFIDPANVVVFHAMMLRHNLVRNLGLDRFITPEYATQRA